MRKPRIKLMAVLVLLGLAAAGCTKENVTDNTIVVATTQSATYIVDGVRHYANPQNEDEWSEFIDQMFALAENGYTVQNSETDVMIVNRSQHPDGNNYPLVPLNSMKNLEWVTKHPAPTTSEVDNICIYNQ